LKLTENEGDQVVTFLYLKRFKALLRSFFIFKCIKHVDEMKGSNCHGSVIKNGKTGYGKQRYRCKKCKKSFLHDYTYMASKKDTNQWIIQLIKEGVGIRSIARLLFISPTTVLKRILEIAKQIQLPIIKYNQTYELDEMCTYLGKKTRRIWIVYALNRETKEVVSFNVGRRTYRTLRVVSDKLLLSSAKRIYTDKLKQYKTLIPKQIHKVKQYGINHIERMNLTLRTHIKRLNRRPICYTKHSQVLRAILAIYFWS